MTGWIDPRSMSADAPERVRQEAEQILRGLPIDKNAAAKHRRELVAAMRTWKGPR